MALKEFIKLVISNLKLILLITICVGIGSSCVAYGFLPNEYTSLMTVYVIPKGDSNSSFNKTLELDKEQTYFDWNAEFSASQQLTNDISKLVKSNKIRTEVKEELSIENLDDYKIDVESSEKNRVLFFKVKSTDPVMATKVADSIARHTADLSKKVLDLESVNIIDDPLVPDKPSGPMRGFIIFVSVCAGLFLSILIVYIKELLTEKAHSSKHKKSKESINFPITANFKKQQS